MTIKEAYTMRFMPQATKEIARSVRISSLNDKRRCNVSLIT
ncbi:MAG: hypothetical protein ACPG7G_00045 [Acidimicrobiales bacterium]